jgi:hypothetical protein
MLSGCKQGARMLGHLCEACVRVTGQCAVIGADVSAVTLQKGVEARSGMKVRALRFGILPRVFRAAGRLFVEMLDVLGRVLWGRVMYGRKPDACSLALLLSSLLLSDESFLLTTRDGRAYTVCR